MAKEEITLNIKSLKEHGKKTSIFSPLTGETREGVNTTAFYLNLGFILNGKIKCNV